MINIIDEIFRNNGFTPMEQVEIKKQSEDVTRKTVLKKIYINKFDEMYFVVEGNIGKHTLDEIIEICLEAEKNNGITKSYRSNWVLVLLTSIDAELSWDQRKHVLFIEENKYFCRKYVMWYTANEKEELDKMCDRNYSTSNINSIIENYSNFKSFKNFENKGYACLSRIFIKLPFLSLTDLSITDKTILDYIKKELNGISKGLAEKLETGDLENIESDIILSEKEQRIIDKKVAVLTKEKK